MARVRRPRPVRVLLVLVAFALGATSCGIVGGGGTYEVIAYFPRAVSLYESGAVQVLGLPAGEVTDIEVQGDRVKVTMAVDDDIPLPADLKAALVPQSLIGERRVQLFPPFQEGDPLAQDGHEIALEDTVIPVEPDEALAALKEFLDSLDPNGVGRLIDNAATSVDGQGEQLGSALDELSSLVGNIEDGDEEIIAIAEHFDDFTATLLTREAQLADVLEDFAVVADVLADEREDLETLVSSLANLSVDGLDLVSEHAVRLRADVAILERLTSAIQVNLDSVTDLVAAGPALADGFIGAFNEDLRAFDLRNSFGPLVQEALSPVFDDADVPFPCIPVDVACDGLTGEEVAPLDAGESVGADLAVPTTPIDDIIAFLGSDTVPMTGPAADGHSSDSHSDRGVLASFLGTLLGVAP